MSTIINPNSPSSFQGDDKDTKILTAQNIKTPQEMLHYMMSDMRQLVGGFEQLKGNDILFVAQINKLGAIVVKLTEENVRLRRILKEKFDIEIEEVAMPDIPEQSKKVLEDFKQQREEQEANAFAPNPNFVEDED